MKPMTAVGTQLNRRRFIRNAALISAAAAGLGSTPAAGQPFVQTVLGPGDASKLGFTLPHEHVLCDFIGADKTGPGRWEVTAVVSRMRPFLQDLKARGITTFVD